MPTPSTRVRKRVRGALILGLLLLAATTAGATPLDDAKDAVEEGRWSEAADLFAEVVAAEPGRRDGLVGLARSVVEAKRWDLFETAETPLQAFHETHRDDVGIRLALGRLFAARAETAPQPLLKKTLLARAKAHYAGLVEDAPDLEEAAVGLALVHRDEGAHTKAIEVLDRYVNLRPKRAARALAWKGRILYEVAKAAHATEGGGYPLSQEVRRLYTRSQGACLSSAVADPTSFDNWMHVAWSSTVVGDRDTALQAYEKAYALDPESRQPLQGIISLLAHDPEAQQKAQERLARLDPDKRAERLKEGYELLAQEAWIELDAVAQAYVREYGEDGDVVYWQGRIEEAAEREERAVARFWRALELDGGHDQAAEELDGRLRKTALVRTQKSLEDARSFVSDYGRILELATKNPYVRNNLAFAMREAWKAHSEDPAWKEALLVSAKYYEDAARVIGPWRAEKEKTIPWGRRYGYAQIVSDTGILFHHFAATKDLARAERYYVRALEYVSWGYPDAWTYLRQLYETQERWQDLYDLAIRCGEGLAGENGQPLEKPRDEARALAAELLTSGKASAP